jgi:hypothetical protein
MVVRVLLVVLLTVACGLGGCANELWKTHAQLSYDACVGYFNQHHNTLNTSWSMVSGFSHGWGHYTTSCYGDDGEQTIQEATDKAMARCTADYGANCHVFATNQGSPAWVDAIDHHNGRDPGVNVDTPSGNVATAAIQPETSSGSSDWDFSNALRKTVGGLAMFAGTVSGDTNLQMQGAQAWDNANSSNSGVTTTPTPVGSGRSTNNASSNNVNAIVAACQSKAASKYEAIGQASKYMQAGCLDYCVWHRTGDKNMLQMYQQAQNDATNICSAGSTCSNTIDTGYCQ